jgi:hypothetical protein
MPATMQSCIEECLSCHRICVETTAHCLEKGGKHAAADHIRTMLDCAQICATSADFMLRGSDLHTETCAACAAVCEACAESCEQIADDDIMKRCADACRRCAASCREMSGTRRAA